MKQSKKVVFKSYTPKQAMLLPPSLEELIDCNHPVRVVNQVIDRIDISPLLAKYPGGGSSSYHPRMLLKVLVYGYLSNIYSSRKLEAAMKENIHFMWLCGMNRADHNTINRFRSGRLKGVLKKIFAHVVELLVEEGILNIKSIYTDGTKIEANANRYTFVWGKTIKINKERIKKQLEELWAYTQQVAREELEDRVPSGFDPIDAEKVAETIQKIDQALKDKPVSKKVKQKLAYAKKNWPDKLSEYEKKEKTLGKRNSYSKTDPDATFMRMKEDHLKNGQLKPAYNCQLSTSDQFIVNYSIHQSPADTNTLTTHLARYEELYGQMPEELTADAGYGSEENYEFLEKHHIEAFVKYNYFYKEQKNKRYREDPFRAENLYYNPHQDCYYCPMGQKMVNIGQEKRTNANGYEQIYTRYQAQNCYGCPLTGACHKGNGNRVIKVNHRLNHFKKKVREKLLSQRGIEHRKKRTCDVETVIGIIKHNHGFRRFMLRGLEKVEIELGLIAIAHNIRKIAA